MEWLKKNLGITLSVSGLIIIGLVLYNGYVTDWKFTKQTV